jgi:hypothetical protein
LHQNTARYLQDVGKKLERLVQNLDKKKKDKSAQNAANMLMNASSNGAANGGPVNGDVFRKPNAVAGLQSFHQSILFFFGEGGGE